MNINAIIAAMQSQFGMTTVRVCYQAGGKEYTFKALKSQGLTTGDSVVVPGENGMKVCTVTGVDRNPSAKLYDTSIDWKWVVQKVDLAGYLDTVQKEVTLIEEVSNLVLEDTRRRALETFMSSLTPATQEQFTKLLTGDNQ